LINFEKDSYKHFIISPLNVLYLYHSYTHIIVSKLYPVCITDCTFFCSHSIIPAFFFLPNKQGGRRENEEQKQEKYDDFVFDIFILVRQSITLSYDIPQLDAHSFLEQNQNAEI
jgi:hypothetical protein